MYKNACAVKVLLAINIVADTRLENTLPSANVFRQSDYDYYHVWTGNY